MSRPAEPTEQEVAGGYLIVSNGTTGWQYGARPDGVLTEEQRWYCAAERTASLAVARKRDAESTERAIPFWEQHSPPVAERMRAVAARHRKEFEAYLTRYREIMAYAVERGWAHYPPEKDAPGTTGGQLDMFGGAA